MEAGRSLAAENAVAVALDETSIERPTAPRCRERRRPGRFRRWILRPLIWGIALVAVLVFLLQLVVNTRYFRDWARTEIAGRVGELLRREVNIRDISLTLLPLSVEIWGFRIEAPEGMESDQPFLEIPWAAIDADLQALRQKVIRLSEVRIERPRIYLQYLPDGENNLLKLARKDRKPRTTPRRFDVYIEHVEIEKAEILIDQESVRLSLSGDAIRAQFQGVGHLHIAGELAGQNVVVRLPNARPFAVAVFGKGSLQRGRIHIEAASVSGPGVRAEGSGVCGWPLDDVFNKKCEFKVSGSTSGEKLADIGYFPYLRGAIGFDGEVTWRPGTVGWRSKIRAPRLTIWDRLLEDVEGVLVADRYQVRIVLQKARYGGGEIEGTIDVATKEEGRPVVIDLDFEDVPVDLLLADQNIPVGPFASRVSGNVVYRCPMKEGRRGSGQGEVTVSADPELAGLPLAGKFPLRIDTGVVHIDSVVLSSERQSVLASGFYDVDRLEGRFDYELATADIVPVIEALRLVKDGEPWPQWLPTAGEGEIRGTAYLLPGEASTRLSLDLDKVYGPDIPTPHVMTGGFLVDRRGLYELRIQLKQSAFLLGDTSLVFHGHVPFVAEGETYQPDDPLRMVFEARDWPLESVHPWLDFEVPVDGRISGVLDLHVDDVGSDGRMRAVVSPAVFRDVPLDAMAGRLNWNTERLELHELLLRAPAGEMVGQGTLTWLSPSGDVAEALDVNLSAAALEIGESPLSRYLPRPDMSGEVALTAHVSGSRMRPRVVLRVKAEGLAVGSRVLEARPSELDLEWADGSLQASGRLLDLVTLKGGGVLDQERANLVFDLDGNDVAGILELLYEEPPQGVDGTFGGQLRLSGKKGGEPRIDFALDRAEVEFRGRRISNLEPVVFSLHSDHLEISSLYLEERATGSELFLAGNMGYAGTAPVDLRFQGTLSNSWLRLYEPSVRVGGYFDVLGKIAGTVERPHLEGQGAVRGASIVFEGLPDFPHTLEDLRGVLRFYPEGVVIDHLEGELAGGRISVEGRGEVPRRGEPLSYRLQLSGQDLRIRYPDGWLVEGDVELTLRTLEPEAGGADPVEQSYLLAGSADLRRLEYNEDVSLGFTQVIQDTLLRQRLEVSPADQLLSLIQLNVEVSGGQAFKVHNNLAELTGSIDGRLHGNLAQPIFLGSVELDPGGQLIYSSVDYEIDRGRLIFANPARFNPEVDLVAATRVRDFDIVLTLTGTMERLNAGFTSEPPLPALEVFELLATGGDEKLESNTVRRADEIGQEHSMSAASFLYGQAAEVIGERVSNLFGFDKFRIAPLTGSGDNLSTARVTVGKRISKDIFLSYSADPSSTEEQHLRIEWQVGRGLVLVLTQNGDSTYEVDARWETSF